MDDCCDYSGAISNVGVADRTPSFASDNIIWIAAVVQVLRTSQYNNLKRVALLPVSGTVLQLGLKSQRISDKSILLKDSSNICSLLLSWDCLIILVILSLLFALDMK